MSGLGVAGVVIGLCCCAVSLVPLLGLLAIPGAVLGGVLSLVGLAVAATGRRSGLGWPVAGMAANVVAVVLSIGMTYVVARAARESARQVQAQLDADFARRKTEIEARAKRAAERP